MIWMRLADHVACMEDMRKAYKVEGKRPFGRSRRRLGE
jgi:hypothetical protein